MDVNRLYVYRRDVHTGAVIKSAPPPFGATRFIIFCSTASAVVNTAVVRTSLHAFYAVDATKVFKKKKKQMK